MRMKKVGVGDIYIRTRNERKGLLKWEYLYVTQS